MLTYNLENRGSDSLYETLYRQIKQDILAGKLASNEKLPSKRELAKHLSISVITVENAYAQLVAEGYLYAIAKSGFYVSDVSFLHPETQGEMEDLSPKKVRSEKEYLFDFAGNTANSDHFPFQTWLRLMRESVSDHKEQLLVKSPSIGLYELRYAIAGYLDQFRGLRVSPEQIVVGAGTEYLYGLMIQLLGHDLVYAVEEPGYRMIRRIYEANHVKCVDIPLDGSGVVLSKLEESKANILHITPSHHFPLGIVMPISRRYELLSWASKSDHRYIIEDDYDSEFRFKGKPIPALQSADTNDRVIYINTFSKSLSSTIRISYMVLPKALMKKYEQQLSFYACTVSNFEQYTMAKFIAQGYFERHINRMRNYYRTIRDIILDQIDQRTGGKGVVIAGEDSGLHFLLQVDAKLSDEQLIACAAKNGIRVSCLSQYYYDQKKAVPHIFVINYAGLHADTVREGIQRLLDCLLA